MALPDLVNETLTFLDTNWNTSKIAKPTLIDGDEMRDFNDNTRAKSADAKNENIIIVDSSPTGTNEPTGTEYDHKVRHGVGVSIEGYHADGSAGGNVTDKDEFDTLATEAQRAILVNRTYPITNSGENGFTHLAIEEFNDNSADEGDAHYFRALFDVWYEGFETLP